jgi:hypothetical protein
MAETLKWKVTHTGDRPHLISLASSRIKTIYSTMSNREQKDWWWGWFDARPDLEKNFIQLMQTRENDGRKSFAKHAR